MKKQFSLLLAATALSVGTIAFTSCKKDPKNNTPTLVGKWELAREVSASADSSTTPPTLDGYDSTYASGKSIVVEFRSDNTATSTDYRVTPNDVSTGTYSVSGNTLSLTEGGMTIDATYVLTSNNLTITSTDNGQGYSSSIVQTYNKK